MTYGSRRAGDVPTVSVDEMREVDRLMVEEVGIDLVQMMENAGRGLADLVVSRHPAEEVTVLAGSGGNGGGGLVAARHLANRGVSVGVTMSTLEVGEVTARQLSSVVAMGIEVSDRPRAAPVIIDALVGYSLKGDPWGRVAELIEWANDARASVIALDVPSGVDPDSGRPGTPAIRADATMAIALPKVGLTRSGLVGDLYLVDISVPATVYSSIGVEVAPDLFADSQLLRLTHP